MTIKNVSILALIGVLALSGAASAGSHVITNGEVGISGATLFENFFKSASITNDAEPDTDGDGVYGFNSARSPVVDQLAYDWTDFNNAPPAYGTDSTAGESYFYVHYRGTSSGTGFGELLNYHANGTSPANNPSDTSYINRTKFYDADTGGYVNNGQVDVIANARIDIAIMDVPTPWMTVGSTPTNAGPTQDTLGSGYGLCPTTSWDTGQAQQLKSKTVGSTTFNTNGNDALSLFDTELAHVSESFIYNPGVYSADRNVVDESSSADFGETGDYSTKADGTMVGFKKTQMQTLFATGRMDTGENLVAATRNGGSGTRNGAMNSVNLDPSWGRGDNLGSKLSDKTTTDLDGVDFQATNLSSSSRMQEVVSRGRLIVGYQGIDKAESKSDGGKVVEHAAMMNDLSYEGGTKHVYPDKSDKMFENADVNTGWRIGGNETLITVGNPYETDTTDPTYMGGAERPAAEFITNITDSLDTLASGGGSSEDYFMPGEYIKENYMSPDAMEARPVPTTRTWQSQTANTDLQDSYSTAQRFLERGLKAPVRDSDYSYDDGASGTTGYRYYDASNNAQTLAGAGEMNMRNLVQGDFNDDEQRNIDDIEKMMECVTYTPTAADTAAGRTNAVLAWAWNENAAASDYNMGGVMPHIIGDYNNDGNFDEEDIRYFADGLAYDSTKTVNGKTGLINRVQAFIDVDAEFGGNYFGTTLNGQTPTSWTNGASQFDVAGSDSTAALFGATPGAAPNGSDGDIDGYDISYVQKVLMGLPGTPGDQNSDNTLSWLDASGNVNLLEAISMDLSVDFDGDFDNDAADLQELFDLLETGYGDANLDSVVNLSDLSLLGNNYGSTTNTYWEIGDFNADDVVNLSDLSILGNNYGTSYSAPLNGAIQTPEPATMTLLGLGGLVLLRRRRRN